MLMFDTDKNGTIGFDEFAGLWGYINHWKEIFRRYDKDNSNYIDRDELQTALSELGYNLPSHVLNLIEQKYGVTTAPTPIFSGRQPAGIPASGITFDRFVRACAAINQSTMVFRKLDTSGNGQISVDYNKFMTIVFSVP